MGELALHPSAMEQKLFPELLQDALLIRQLHRPCIHFKFVTPQLAPEVTRKGSDTNTSCVLHT